MPAAQVHLIPINELSVAEIGAIRNQTIAGIVQKASVEWKLTAEQIVVREIRPATDLDFSTEDWFEVTGATINAYETMTTGNMGDQQYLVIYGVKDDGLPAVTLLRFNIGGGDRAIWNLQGLYAVNGNDDRIGFSPSAIIVPPRNPYTISRYVRLIRSPSHLILKGVIVENRGRTLTP